MGRILYNVVTKGAVSGGHKMAVRHVETLRELGFDAVCYLAAGSVAPAWFAHTAPFEVTPRIQPDDIVVIADDATRAMQALAPTQIRTVVFSQNPYLCAAWAFDVLDRFAPDRFPHVIAVSQGLGATIARAYPQAGVDIVPCFADERLFAPARDKAFEVCFAPRKRPLEAQAIPQFLRKLHPRHGDLAWTELNDVAEARMAEALGRSALFLSLNRLESVGMTTLEAMASGCLCAGFTGVGGLEYATPQNGLWAPDEDCEAAADALAAAADLVRSGGPALDACLEAARETARLWSYARFRGALEETWTRLAPEMRRLPTWTG